MVTHCDHIVGCWFKSGYFMPDGDTFRDQRWLMWCDHWHGESPCQISYVDSVAQGDWCSGGISHHRTGSRPGLEQSCGSRPQRHFTDNMSIGAK